MKGDCVNKIKEMFFKNKIKYYDLEEKIFAKNHDWAEACFLAAIWRLEKLEVKLGKKFRSVRKHYIDTSAKNRTGIEQKIGGAVTPLGIAGPLTINGEYAKGEFFIPIATNEAALIAGLNKGIKCINLSGGVQSFVSRDFMTRAPVLEFKNIEEGRHLCEELRKRRDFYRKVKEAAEKESLVSKLIDVSSFQLGRFVWLRFSFQTGDSMGMNSATKYSANAIRVIKDKYDCRLVSLSGNLCSDKKSAHINVLFGRGKKVETEVFIKKSVLKRVYNTSPEIMEKINNVKNYMASGLAGTINGFNANAANTVAGMFIATGQDAAQIVESSGCFTLARVVKKGLLFGVSMPNLEVATVGGGTSFETAKDCLEILGCYGPGKRPGDNARKLAEIIAAAVTAQELNLLGALANEYELADSHIRLARGKK
jgi:hydroxymethylglutaryl-CoA reductase (NADPH)